MCFGRFELLLYYVNLEKASPRIDFVHNTIFIHMQPLFVSWVKMTPYDIYPFVKKHGGQKDFYPSIKLVKQRILNVYYGTSSRLQ